VDTPSRFSVWVDMVSIKGSIYLLAYQGLHWTLSWWYIIVLLSHEGRESENRFQIQGKWASVTSERKFKICATATWLHDLIPLPLTIRCLAQPASERSIKLSKLVGSANRINDGANWYLMCRCVCLSAETFEGPIRRGVLAISATFTPHRRSTSGFMSLTVASPFEEM